LGWLEVAMPEGAAECDGIGGGGGVEADGEYGGLDSFYYLGVLWGGE
jgi:hypothetical protein